MPVSDDTGWRRPIGCLKLQVIFRKRATNYMALLRKMTYKDKASYGSSPPSLYQIQDCKTEKSLLQIWGLLSMTAWPGKNFYVYFAGFCVTVIGLFVVSKETYEYDKDNCKRGHQSTLAPCLRLHTHTYILSLSLSLSLSLWPRSRTLPSLALSRSVTPSLSLSLARAHALSLFLFLLFSLCLSLSHTHTHLISVLGPTPSNTS